MRDRRSRLSPIPKDVIHFTLVIAEESIQKAVVYDRAGAFYYDTISAFIKACAHPMKKTP
jgi:hypothetical protein